MANELNVSVGLAFAKGNYDIDWYLSKLVTVTGTNYARFNQTILTSETALSVPSDIGTQGYVIIRNNDSTNYVTVGTTGKLAIKLKAGETACFRTNGALYAQANTSSIEIEGLIIED